MASQQKGPGLGKKILQIFGYLVLAGFVWALLKQFDLDPFQVVEWAFGHVINLIDHISNFFMGTEIFQDGTKAPGIVNFFNKK